MRRLIPRLFGAALVAVTLFACPDLFAQTKAKEKRPKPRTTQETPKAESRPKPEKPTDDKNDKGEKSDKADKKEEKKTPKDKSDGKPQKPLRFDVVEIEGRLKSPQLVYFLRRVRAEFATGELGHRSFLGELSETRKATEF